MCYCVVVSPGNGVMFHPSMRVMGFNGHQVNLTLRTLLARNFPKEPP